MSNKFTETAYSSLRGVRLSEWIDVDGYCCTRVVEGADPSVIENRIAFIEKSPRVLVDGVWVYGPKGPGGSTEEWSAEDQRIFGFYPPSREWADNVLRQNGAILPDDLPFIGRGARV